MISLLHFAPDLCINHGAIVALALDIFPNHVREEPTGPCAILPRSIRPSIWGLDLEAILYAGHLLLFWRTAWQQAAKDLIRPDGDRANPSRRRGTCLDL